ncbi:MAG: penicillin-binding transpeptidase domain-containing protein, partial [Defluviitaleaceae bacterium]|nr:penicillin-binding transpeptidase domain-containing protein [Defluviitaleaceae bacterium]
SDDGGLFSARLKSGALTERQAVIEKILALEITPQMIAMDPFSGSAVVVDVRDGSVLAAAGYPSYDNNYFVNNFDNEYYYQVYYDPTEPMIDRPFREPRAPGSTFKMITATAALEAGVINASSLIYDEVTYKKTGLPYTNCWNAYGHGWLNIYQAIQFSCNYFFCEAAYRLGNASNGRTLDGIAKLNDYMVYYGLNDKTGVEIGELYNQYDGSDLHYKISSPEFKAYRARLFDPFAPRIETDWYDGNTVHTAIGQFENNYTTATMAKYISVIANRGVRYPLHLVDYVKDFTGSETWRHESVPEEQFVEVADSTWDIIREGMRLVTQQGGTAQNYFRDFPIRIAGKTGTAQQQRNRPDHSSFAAFAPYDDPIIAVYVMVPYGVSNALTHISAQIAIYLIEEALLLGYGPERPEPLNQLRR